ncbi:phage/plasmid primase, P4 family [Clostridium tyrobutyricum]|uniref:phage/plasmid primase, P4 family n=1 Tax=Clostridium tyrobutyricum TaxID=1519 RepID=UPI001C3933F8|nr:phage/plasmid primase, P4 family [Clostridium tyrobutyricum]
MQQMNNNFNNIPQDLKKHDNWVLWKYQEVKGRKTKIPYQVNGKIASSTNLDTWTKFDNVIETYNKGQYSGIGFVFTNTDITGIDLDHILSQEGSINKDTQDIINQFSSYTEYSPSGEGIHIYVHGNIPKAIKKDIEIYSTGRFFTVTGNKICGDSIENRQDILNEFYEKYHKNNPEITKNKIINNKDIDELLNKAFMSKNGFKIETLYRGEWECLGYPSQSEAEQAFCNYMAFWCDKNPELIDQAFRKSGLYREKWNRQDYRDWTINKAIRDCGETYQEYLEKNKLNKSSDYNTTMKFIYVNNRGKKCVNTGLLADYIRENYNYMIVRKQGFDNDFLYWYENGYYKRMSANEFKGKIKDFIPVEIRKPHQWEEVYKELITDKASIRFDDLNMCSNYINVKNGLYNVTSKSLEKHNSDIKSTIQLNCNYDLKAERPTEWLKFISMLSNGNKKTMDILQEWFGLTISNIQGSITKKCLALWGTVGNTGKTQYNNMLIYLIGDSNICTVPIQDFSKTFATGDIYGAKAIIIDDQKSTNIDDSSVFKSITGGGFIRCEIKGKQAFPYKFNGTLTFGCNDLPYFKGDKGDHLFERFIVIPCDNVIPEEKRIGDIIERFELEADGVFLWGLEGLHRLIDNNYKFTHSGACDRALEEYRQANDSLYKFIKQNYLITDNKKDRIRKTDFEGEYAAWALRNDITALEKKNIQARAMKHGIPLIKLHGDYYYRGIIRK